MGFLEIPDRFNMADYFLYDRLREGLGKKVAIRTRTDAWSYDRVAAESNRFGNALRALGLLPEERVLLSLPDVPEFAAGIFGALRVGGVVAMVNPLLPAEDLGYYIEYTRCRVLFCDADVAAKVAAKVDAFPLLKAIIVWGDPTPDHKKFRPYAGIVRESAAECEAHATTKDDPAYWLFTSGSTGKPKAAMHLHHDFPWNCERYAKATLGYRRDDVTLSVPRLFFGYGTGTNLFFPFSVGATTVLFPEKPTPEALFELIDRFHPTILTTVPTSIRGMVDHPEAASHDLSSLRFAVTAGEALPPELYQRWMRAFGVELLDGIGSAETFHIYITNAPGDVTPGCLGRLVPGYEARIVGPDGKDVAAGEMGTLMVRGDSVAVGYWQAHEKSKETFLGDWVRSADLFRRDEAGRFWYAGRNDDMLKVGGIFVSPLEIEDCLLQHPAVAETCVVPYSDEGLEKPIAFVLLRPGHDGGPTLAVELARFAKGRLAAYKFPRRIRFVDGFPRNDRGKIERRTLREQVGRDGAADAIDVERVLKASTP